MVPSLRGYLAQTRCSRCVGRVGRPLTRDVSRALCELVACCFVMRSVDHHEARSVGQSRAASASQIVRNATSRSKGRRGNGAYRVREHLTEAEMEQAAGRLQVQPARSPGLADQTRHVPPRPADLTDLRSALG